MEHERIVLGIIILGTLMGAIDTTIVLLALPDITQALGSNLAATIWTILIYLLVLTVVTTQFGRLGDLFGRSRMFNFGFLVFTVGSALCGLSTSAGMLIGFRAVQAVGGAFLTATSGAIIADTFEVGRRGRAYGYTGMGWNMGAMLGIVLGGVLTTFLGWQYIFYINVPIGVVALFLGMKYLRDNPRVQARLDLAGMVLFAVALASLSYGAVDFASEGAAPLNIALVVAGALLVLAFIAWEKRSSSPMLNMRAFANRVLSASIFASFFQALGFLSVAFVVILYLQGIRGLDPFTASLVLVPGYVISSFTSPFMGRLSDRFGARVIATTGIAFLIAAVLVYLTINATTSLYVIVFASILSGFGGSMFWPANNSAVMSNAEPGHYGSISGVLRFMSSIGTLGSFVIAITAATMAVPRSTAFGVFVGTSKLIGGLSAGFLDGIHVAFAVALVILVVAGILSAARGKEQRQTHAGRQARQRGAH
jgi:EmrB/QacA subfamily drug resistance transporter